MANSVPAQQTQTPLYGERAIAEAELVCFDNPRPGRPYEVSIELPEFTCKCPFSGYPDFAVLRLIYQPGPRVVELKAIKLYVNSYRDQSISHEEVTNRILDDLVAATDPAWMQLEADFNPWQCSHRGTGEPRCPSALLIGRLSNSLQKPQLVRKSRQVAVAKAAHVAGHHELSPTAGGSRPG